MDLVATCYYGCLGFQNFKRRAIPAQFPELKNLQPARRLRLRPSVWCPPPALPEAPSLRRRAHGRVITVQHLWGSHKISFEGFTTSERSSLSSISSFLSSSVPSFHASHTADRTRFLILLCAFSLYMALHHVFCSTSTLLLKCIAEEGKRRL